MSPALPFLQQELGLSLIAAGWIVSMFNAVAIAAGLFFGLASDRIGALRFCLFGLGAQVAGGVLGMAANGATLLLVSRVVEGIGFLATVVAAPVLMAAAAAPAQRGFAFGLWGTYMPVGGFLMVAFSPLLLGFGGWRGVWGTLVFAMIACIALLAFQSRHYAGVARARRRPLADILASLRQPVPWLLGSAFAFYTLQFYTVMVWLPTYLLVTRGMGASASALLTALYILANALGNLTGSWLVHRRATRGRTIGVVFVATALLFLGMFSPALPDLLRFLLVLLYGLVTGIIPPTALAGGMSYARTPAEVGSMQGLIAQLSNLGTFAGAPIVATAVTMSGTWNAALWVLLAAGALGLAAAWGIHRLESRNSARGVRL